MKLTCFSRPGLLIAVLGCSVLVGGLILIALPSGDPAARSTIATTDGAPHADAVVAASRVEAPAPVASPAMERAPESEPAAQLALEPVASDPVLAKRVALLRQNLEQFRAGPNRLNAESMLESLILAECDATGNFTEMARGGRVELPPSTLDERTMTSTSADHHRLYRVRKSEYPEYWTFVVDPMLRQSQELFGDAEPLDAIAQVQLIQRAEQTLAAVGEQ